MYLCHVNNHKNDKAMALPIRFAPVLTGNDAVEFYERWQKSLEEPQKRRLSNEKIKNIEEFFRQHELEKLNKLNKRNKLEEPNELRN